MVDLVGFEPTCYLVCQTSDHPKQSQGPNLMVLKMGFEPT